MHQMMFALAYEEFGTGNQEAFFQLGMDYNKVAPPGKRLGPQKILVTKKSAPLSEKGQVHIGKFHKLSGKILHNYSEFALPYLEPDFEPPESLDYQLFSILFGIGSNQTIVHFSTRQERDVWRAKRWTSCCSTALGLPP